MSTIFLPMRAPPRSAPVSTALTPGTASALPVSRRRMRPWAMELLSTLHQSMSGTCMSAVYRARPETLSSPSPRVAGTPTILPFAIRSPRFRQISFQTLARLSP